MKPTCDNCQGRANRDGSDCRYISATSQRKGDSSGDDDARACGLWEPEPDRFYIVEEKGFKAFPILPDKHDYEKTKDRPIVKIKNIAKAYVKLNRWKRSVIIFYFEESEMHGYSTVLMPQGGVDHKTITKLIKAMIPLVDFNCIIIDDLWDKTEEDVARAVALERSTVPF